MTSFSSLILSPDHAYSDRQIKDAVDNYLPIIPNYQYHYMIVGFLLYPCIEVFLSPSLGTLSYSEHEEQYGYITSYNPNCFNEEGEDAEFYLEADRKFLQRLEYTLPKEDIINAVTHFAERKTMPKEMLFFQHEDYKVLRSRELSGYIRSTNI